MFKINWQLTLKCKNKHFYHNLCSNEGTTAKKGGGRQVIGKGSGLEALSSENHY